MNFKDTDAVFKRYERLKAGRANWESHWEEIAERVLPRSSEFTGNRTPGDKRTAKLYDATSALALERFAAAVESLLTPRGAKWHTLRASDPGLNAVPEVAEWFDQVERILFHYRYAPKTNFASQMHEDICLLAHSARAACSLMRSLTKVSATALCISAICLLPKTNMASLILYSVV